MADPDAATEIGRLTLAEEVATIRRRRLRRRVRVAVTTSVENETLEAVLHRRHAEIERVPIGREVETAPPVRQDGDVLVIPVLEERLVLVRRLVLTEEIRLRLHTEEEAVTLPVTRRRQSVAVERHPAEEVASTEDTLISAHGAFMTRTLIAFFDSRSEAERAGEALRGLNVRASDVQVRDSSAAGASAGMPGQDDDRLAWSGVGSSWLPEEDRATYHEGLRRGGAIVSAEVAEEDMQLAMDAMEAAGAVDLDAREAEWRSQGWTGGATSGTATGTAAGVAGGSAAGLTTGLTGSSNPPGTMASRGIDQLAGTNISGAHPENETRRTGTANMGSAAAGTTGTGTTATGLTGREESIPLAEERLRIGKRETHAGRVRVRSYVVETPVEEQVTLREEHVRVERRPADSPGIAGDADLFRERVIEAEESSEEAVVQKDVRVTGEVVVNKDVTERTETIRDTVRRTEVEVDENATANDRTRRGDKGVA